MTVTADSKRRVIVPGTSPGDRFDVQFPDADRIVFHRLCIRETRPVPVKLERRGTFTVGVSSQAVNPVALAEALAEFP